MAEETEIVTWNGTSEGLKISDLENSSLYHEDKCYQVAKSVVNFLDQKKNSFVVIYISNKPITHCIVV